jgi:hypothetical protein
MAEEAAKHGPRVDEELAHETQGLVRGGHDEGRTEARRQQAPGPGEPELHAPTRPELARRGPAAGDVEGRTRLAGALEGTHYPAGRASLVEAARSNSAPQELIDRLAGLPDRRTFDTVQEVWEAVRAA